MQKLETRILLLPDNREDRREYLDQLCVKGWRLVSVVQRGEELEAYLQRPTNAGALSGTGG